MSITALVSRNLESRSSAFTSTLFGLIGEEDFARSELYGFEIDSTGKPVIPELCPDADKRIRERIRRICIEWSSESIDRFFQGLRSEVSHRPSF